MTHRSAETSDRPAPSPAGWRSTLLASSPGIVHGCTSRHYGRLRFGSAPDDVILANRTNLASDNGFRLEDAVTSEQVHGCGVAIVGPRDRGAGALSNATYIAGADALITRHPGIVLVARSADCVPLLFHDPEHRVIAAVHAGWRGTLGGIAGRTMDTMRAEFGVRSRDLRVAIGPCIKGCHYDVSQTTDGRVAAFEEQFQRNPAVVIRRGDRVSLDLAEANRLQCLAAGMAPDQIDTCPVCTFESVDIWPSHRAGDTRCDHQTWSFIRIA